MTDRREPFWRDVGVVLSGSAIAQAIPLVGSLLLARLFVPAEFGRFAAWLSVVTLAAVAATGRYEMAIVLEGTAAGRRAGATATLAVAVVAAAALGLCSVMTLLLLESFPGSLSPSLVALLAPATLLVALSQTWQSWAASEARFGDLSAMRIAQAASITILQVFAGLMSPSAAALAAAYAIGAGFGVVFAFRRMPAARLYWSEVRAFLGRHLAFPTWSLPSGFISSGAAQLPVLVLAARFGAEVAGLLALALRVLGAPTALLGASVLDVFKVGAARSYAQSGQCRTEYLRTLKGLALGSVIVSAVLAAVSERLFAFAFGSVWREAGVMALWLIPMFALRFVASPLSYMFFIAQRQRLDLLWQVGLLAMTVTSLTVGPTYPAALKLYSAGYSAMYLVYLWMSYRLSCGGRTG